MNIFRKSLFTSYNAKKEDGALEELIMTVHDNSKDRLAELRKELIDFMVAVSIASKISPKLIAKAFNKIEIGKYSILLKKAILDVIAEKENKLKKSLGKTCIISKKMVK